jgi:4-amino-4-deoxy-L-arabinose transferase-like glycosyltransferase
MQDSSAFSSGLTDKPITENKLTRLDYAVILLLFVAALTVRLYLYRFQDVISIDGTGYVGAARKLLTGDISGLSFYGFYPILTWLLGLAVPDMDTAAQLVSVIMGSLLVVPLYLLGSMLFSRSTAIAACLVTIVWSSHLFVSSIVATQAAYTTLALTACYLVWRMFERQSASYGFWAGFVMGLAFLTRPEAFLLFFVMPLAPLINKRRELHLLWRSLLAYIAVFSLILGLNLILVHQFTGKWQLAAKTSTALNDTLSYHLNINDMNKIPGTESMGYLKFITKYPDLLIKNPAANLKTMFETIMPATLWLLALIGFFIGVFRRERIFRQLFLLSSLAPLAVIVVFYYISAGYVEPFLPVLFLWCAEGGLRIERITTGLLPVTVRHRLEHITRYSPAILSASLIYATVLLVPQIPARRDLSTYTWQEDDSRRDQKNIGLLLKQYLPPGKIMTQSARVAFYSGHEMVGIPHTDLPGIVKAAAEGNARFLVLHGRMFGTRPPLMYLFKPLHLAPPQYFSLTPGPETKPPGLHLMLIYSNPSSLGVVVYEIVK